MSHSPLPWKVNPTHHRFILDSDLHIVADCQPRHETFPEGYANASLIVSAINSQPKLAETLKTIREYFISKGIPASRISSVTGFGETKPVGSNDTEEGKALNRRVEIKAVH